MAYNWTILRAAVEQEILFPSNQVFTEYVEKLTQKGEPFEIISKHEGDDGTLIVIMRKQYNHNRFLMKGADM